MTLKPIPAFADNYIWMVHDGRDALVVDPGAASPVIDELDREQLQLHTILVTHHHADHVGGIDGLRERLRGRVYGPASERVPEPYEPLTEGCEVQALGLRLRAIAVPGHTAGHLAFYGQDLGGAPVLFCGDTLFSAGCGRFDRCSGCLRCLAPPGCAARTSTRCPTCVSRRPWTPAMPP